MELQHFLIRIRDELCKNGEILMSPALSYSSKHLHGDVDKEKKEKLPKELEEDKIKREEEKQGLCRRGSAASVLWRPSPESELWVSRSGEEGGLGGGAVAVQPPAHLQPGLQLQGQHVPRGRLRVRGAGRAQPAASHHLHRASVAGRHRSASPSPGELQPVPRSSHPQTLFLLPVR